MASLGGMTGILAVLSLALGAPVGCSPDSDASDPADGPSFSVAVAALSLEGVTNATYTLAVSNEDGVTVWTRTLDADSFGDGAGSLSYVGPCDAASDPNADGTADNTVSLVLVSLEDAGGPLVEGVDFANPAPASAPLTRTAACLPDGDTAVTFEVTFARRAQQGFFDVAVTFDDVFCSAKLDCVRPDGPDADSDPDPLLLLHDADGARARTVVMAWACTGGPDTDTHMYLSDVEVVCDGAVVATLDPDDPGGNKGAIAPLVFQHALYLGVEQLTAIGASLSKAYWNIAVGIDEEQLALQTGPCILRATGTATSDPFTAGAAPPDSTWPQLEWNVTLSALGEAELSCTNHALDAPGSGVYIAYAQGQDFVWEFDPDLPNDGAGLEVRNVGGPTCTDGALNGDETGVDCGGPDCPACAPTCTDVTLNGDETDVDCGGPTCPACEDGETCADGADCVSGFCDVDTCAQPPPPSAPTIDCGVAGDSGAGELGDVVLSGTVAINTTTGTITMGGSTIVTGSDSGVSLVSQPELVPDPDGQSAPPQMRVFRFGDVSIAAGTTVQVTGTHALALISDGAITIDGTLDADGELGGYASTNSNASGGAPGPGGTTGGSIAGVSGACDKTGGLNWYHAGIPDGPGWGHSGSCGDDYDYPWFSDIHPATTGEGGRGGGGGGAGCGGSGGGGAAHVTAGGTGDAGPTGSDGQPGEDPSSGGSPSGGDAGIGCHAGNDGAVLPIASPGGTAFSYGASDTLYGGTGGSSGGFGGPGGTGASGDGSFCSTGIALSYHPGGGGGGGGGGGAVLLCAAASFDIAGAGRVDVSGGRGGGGGGPSSPEHGDSCSTGTPPIGGGGGAAASGGGGGGGGGAGGAIHILSASVTVSGTVDAGGGSGGSGGSVFYGSRFGGNGYSGGGAGGDSGTTSDAGDGGGGGDGFIRVQGDTISLTGSTAGVVTQEPL